MPLGHPSPSTPESSHPVPDPAPRTLSLHRPAQVPRSDPGTARAEVPASSPARGAVPSPRRGRGPTCPGERGLSTGAAGAHRRPAASRSGPSGSHSPPRPARPFGLIHAPAPAPPALCLLPARAAPGRGGPTPTRPHSCALRGPDPGRDPRVPQSGLAGAPGPQPQPRPPSAPVAPQNCAPNSGQRYSVLPALLLSGPRGSLNP